MHFRSNIFSKNSHTKLFKSLFLVILATSTYPLTATAQKTTSQRSTIVIQNNFKPLSGDLVFQEGKENSFTKAVQEVTSGYNGAKLSHVGIVFYKGNKPFILEAKDKVQSIPLGKFLYRSCDKNGNPKVIVGRLIKKYQNLIPKAIQIGKTLIGLPYNDTFDIKNNKAFYCSQLVYYCFKKANNGISIFKLHPMTFKSPKTGKIFGIWSEYFKKLKTNVPQGNLGLNPGGMSKSPNIKIIHTYGIL